jgi:hypothetical protein
MPLIAEGDPQRSMGEAMATRTPLEPGAWSLGPGGHRVPVAAATADRPLEEVLRGRRSVREFSGEPLEWRVLSDVLRLARQACGRQYAANVPLAFLLGLRNVAGLASGLYVPAQDLGTARPVYVAETPTEVTRNYADAPALVFIGGPVVGTSGTSYGGLMTQAGALGHAVWLSARSHGLECSVFALPDFRVTRAMRAQDGRTRHLFTVAVGAPVDRPTSGVPAAPRL